MATENVVDKDGNVIYLTDERWSHIIEFHPEMLDYKNHLFATLRKGKRKQNPMEASIYTYFCNFGDLEKGFSHVIVIVKFGVDSKFKPNNFVLTAYQKFIF